MLKKIYAFLETTGLIHQRTVKYTSEQNGVAERTNRTIVEKARCLMQETKSNEKMWAEAINTAVYLKKRSPKWTVNEETPDEIWSGKKIDLSHLTVFGRMAIAHT